jgi:Fe-S cluster assembly protein SufD
VVPLSTLTPELARTLPGPSWLVERRVAAAAALERRALPSTDEEVWRYSRIADLELDDFAPVTGPVPSLPDAAVLPAGARAALDAVPERAAAVVVVDGAVVHVEHGDELRAGGVTVGRLAGAGAGAEALGAVTGEPADLFVAHNDAGTRDPVLIDVPAGTAVAGPVVVVSWVTADAVEVNDRLVVRVGEAAEVTVLDWQGSDDVSALCLPVVELDVAAAAHLRYLSVQERGPQVWQIASQVSRVGRDATLVSVQAALGGSYARCRADCRLVGRGATGNLSAIYFGERDQMLDFRTFQEHVAPDTTSNLLFKGAVSDTSQSVYTGLIKVDKAARGTNAFQTNRNLKLSDGAWAESVPNLEIENNDVRCSHASTVGPVDDDQRFYLESRGVPPEVAERLIVLGFFREVLDQFPVPQVAPLLRDRIDARLGRRARQEQES